MNLPTRIAEAASPEVRAMIFRTALLELSPPQTATALARSCRVSPSTVSLVLLGKQVGGTKGRKVQNAIARLFGLDPDTLFPERGPEGTGGATHRARWAEDEGIRRVTLTRD